MYVIVDYSGLTVDVFGDGAEQDFVCLFHFHVVVKGAQCVEETSIKGCPISATCPMWRLVLCPSRLERMRPFLSSLWDKQVKSSTLTHEIKQSSRICTMYSQTFLKVPNFS
jgi:hypothetical protein